MRGRRFVYHGDPTTRPMKQRVREAAFNLLGPRVRDKHVVDLFAGTGALAWEALSRGARSATLIERHFPTARRIQKNATELEVADRVELVTGDTFIWVETQADHLLARDDAHPWLVFCSPPYELYVGQSEAMLRLIDQMSQKAPAGTSIVVESDERFDTAHLPPQLAWDVRCYPPAVLAVGQVP
jgi:16S rRNA (guanine966-N2)-methyltransferase